MPKKIDYVSTLKTGVAFLILGLPLISACSKSEPESAPEPESTNTSGSEDQIQSAADMLASGGAPDVGADTFAPEQTSLEPDLDRLGNLTGRMAPQSNPVTTAPPPTSPAENTSIGPKSAEIIGVPLAMSSDDSSSEAIAAKSGIPLKKDLSADDLSKFLEVADRDMETIASGRSPVRDPEEARRTLEKLVRGKLEASLKLQIAEDATDKQKSDGLRGQLQALSHLASMGDAAAVKALQALATEHLESSDSSVAGDSRIVLIGFAIDALQAGGDSAGEEIVRLIEGMKPTPTSDVPSVLIMAQARQTLANYGMLDQAVKVREKILELYGGSSNAMIAKVAADAAGAAKFDRLSRLRSRILTDESVVVAHWTDAVSDLVTDSPEMNSVQFLLKSTLELEAADRDDFVTETFSILVDQFNDPESATRREIEMAKLAMEARKRIVGTKYDFSQLPSVRGTGVSLGDMQGKVVLMPFWAMTVPDSLIQIVPLLKEIRDAHPESVAIVGMNIDTDQAPLEEFLAEFDLGFPSFQSVSSATAEIPNQVAARFGLVSMPFVAVIDQQGYVSALSFTGRELPNLVKELLSDEK